MKKVAEEINNASNLAKAAVAFAQQKFPQYFGNERKQKAVEWLATECNKYGIKLSADQIDGYVGSALRSFKDSFGEDWGKIVNNSDINKSQTS